MNELSLKAEAKDMKFVSTICTLKTEQCIMKVISKATERLLCLKGHGKRNI